MMSGVIPTVLSPARVSHALASVGPPAGSGGLRISSTDPLTPGNGIDTQLNGGGRSKSTSPSRAAATAFPISAISASSPLTADASQATTVPSPAAPYLSTPIHGPSGPTTIPIYRASGSGTGESSSAATSARSLNGRRPQTARSFRSRPDSPKTAGGRVLPAPDSSSASLSTTYGAYGGGGVLASPIQRTHAANCGNTRGSRGGLGRDRSFAGSVSSTTGQIRPQHGSLSGGFGSGLESMGAALGSLARGGPVGLQPAPGTAGGIDIARLMAIQRLLDEYDSDDAADPVTSPRAEGSSYRHRSDSAGGDSTRPQGSDSGSGTGSASGLRTIASLRSRKDMQHWQPSVSTTKGSLEEHQQRLRERADVTLHLKRWTEQVLEDARRAAEGGTSGRANDIVRAASVRFKDVPEDPGPSLTAALGEYLDPDQELDEEEERRMEALMALPPNPRGLGTQLRAHFMAVVEEEVNKKFDVMRTKWEAEKGNEAEELRELRESYRDLRRMHMETKEALDKANTRMDVMRLQMKATASISKAGKDGGSAAADTDTNAKSSLRGHRSSTHDGSEGKAGGKGGKGAGGHAAHTGDGGGAVSPSPSSGYGNEDELHDKLRSIGSRRATSPTGDGSGTTPGTAELQQQLKAHAESAITLNRKLQDAEQQLLKLKLDKASLENQLTAARARGASPDPDSAAGTGATGGGAGNKYDADVQIFKLKQEKASLEQQLATAKAKSSGKVGAKGSSGGGSARSGSSSRAMTAASAGKGAAAGKTAELTADVERLQIELAATKREAANSTKEALERRMELQKVKDDLATTQTTLEMALQQIAGVKEAISQEKDRADKAVAAAEAAEAAQAQAEASAAAANSAVAAALIKRSAATDEVQELVERLEKERDAAMTAAAELRQQVRELSQSLGRQAEDVMQLREQLIQRQLEKPAASAAPADAEVPPVAAASVPPPPASGPPPVVAAAAGSMIPPMQSKVTAAAVAAMQSLGVPIRPAPVAARRRPTSALGPAGSAGGGAFEGAVGVAAAAAAAAALVPAVLEVLQQRVPDMVMSLGG
ncbi:hypothetical protein Vafri_18606, partial [Volvox africanus]